MKKVFYGVTLVVKTGYISAESADAYIADNFSGPNVINVGLRNNYFNRVHEIFENIFRETLEALLFLNGVGYHRTVAIGKFTNNTGGLNNYQVVRAILCGMFGFCQLRGVKSGKNNIRKIVLVIPPEALSAAQELERTENFKNFTDISGKKPTMQKILQKEYCPR